MTDQIKSRIDALFRAWDNGVCPGGQVAVRLRGACHGCPASTLTLRHRLEERLRARCPGLVAVVER